MVKKNPNLTAEQKLVMFEDGTEPPGTSELNNEKREGSYHCANCGIKLFNSNSKYESGSGWPSFFESLPEVFETKTDHLIGYARTEYHCKNCGGHHGHIPAVGHVGVARRVSGHLRHGQGTGAAVLHASGRPHRFRTSAGAGKRNPVGLANKHPDGE